MNEEMKPATVVTDLLESKKHLGRLEGFVDLVVEYHAVQSWL